MLTIYPSDRPHVARQSRRTRWIAPNRSINIDPSVVEGDEGLLSPALEKIIAALILVFLVPLMIISALLIKMYDGGPVLFKHRRIGRGGSSFYCLKFRTMTTDADARLAELLARDEAARREWACEHKLRNDPRVTPIGRFMRRSSLDELPQLLNVIRGEMRLVGPRPIVEGEIPRYGRRFAHYCAVKPGLTGLWQVSGRNDVEYRRRVALDYLYVKRRSVALDMWILIATIPAVIQSRGSY